MHELLQQMQLMQHVQTGDLNEVLLDQPFWMYRIELKVNICETAVIHNKLKILKYMLDNHMHSRYTQVMLIALLGYDFEAMNMLYEYNVSLPWEDVLETLPTIQLEQQHVKMLEWLFNRMQPSESCILEKVIPCLVQLPVMFLQALFCYVVSSNKMVNEMEGYMYHIAYFQAYGFQPVVDHLVCLPVELSRRHICVFL